MIVPQLKKRAALADSFNPRWGGAMFVLILAIMFQGACSSDIENSNSLMKSDDMTQALGGMTLRESENGILRWVMIADSAFQVSGDERTELIRLHIDFYNATGDTITSWLSSLTGEIDENTRMMVARDSVVVETRDGKILETEELFWDEQNSEVVSDYFVRITTGESIMTGTGFRSDPELNSCRILSNVQAEMFENDEGLKGIEGNR